MILTFNILRNFQNCSFFKCTLWLNVLSFFPLVGNGGNGGRIKFRFANSKLTGRFQVTTCAGAGAQPAKNGIGGKGKRSFAFFLEKHFERCDLTGLRDVCLRQSVDLVYLSMLQHVLANQMIASFFYSLSGARVTTKPFVI